MNKLSIEILDNQGNLYSEVQDDFKIKSIIMGQSNKSVIIVELDRYVDKFYFRQNDKIVCKLYNLKPEFRELQEFLEEGTILLDAYAESSNGPTVPIGGGGRFDKINRLYLLNKINYTETSASEIDYDYCFTKDVELVDSVPEGTPYGFLINAQHQHNMVIEFTERIPVNDHATLLT